MAQKKQVALGGMKVGIFVTVAFVLLAALILQQSWGVNWFTRSVKVTAYLSDVGGLKPGAPVWLAGIEIGRVRKVTVVPPEVYPGNAQIYRRIDEIRKQQEVIDTKLSSGKKLYEDLQDDIRSLKADIKLVEVQLDIRPQFMNRIAVDSEVSIESRGLIGDSYIDISPGASGVLPHRLGDSYVIESARQAGFREIMTGANDVIANFGVLSEQVKNIAQKIVPEKIGSGVADTIKDAQSAIRQANETFSRANLLLDDLRTGNGTIGRLVADRELYNRLNASLEKFNTIADNVQHGTGSISKLINDPSLFDSATATLKKAEQAMDRIEKGQGTLGRLSKDDELYEKTKRAMDRFASLVEEIEKGKGTLGKLLKDPSLYNNLDQSSAEISKLLYDLRQDPKKYLTIRFRMF
jgi:phospholipid/cholesterol/gamma-HCH transport system substrate-binding protein